MIIRLGFVQTHGPLSAAGLVSYKLDLLQWMVQTEEQMQDKPQLTNLSRFCLAFLTHQDSRVSFSGDSTPRLLDSSSEDPSPMTIQENIFHRVSDDPHRDRVCRRVTLLPSSASIDGHSECSLTAEHIARQRIGNVSTKGLRRSKFLVQRSAPNC
jgi:hypothetical protein